MSERPSGGKISSSALDYGLAALSGVMAAAAFPDFGLWPLAWVCLAPLMFALKNKSVLRSIFISTTAGFVYFSATLFWVSNTMIDYAGMPIWIAAAVNGLMTFTLALYIGLFGYLFAWISRGVSADAALAASPFLWVTMEFFRSNFAFLSFPWARIADSQYTVLPIIQMADLAGEDGLGFLIILVNASVVKIVEWALAGRGERKFPAAWVALAAVLMAAALTYGHWRMGDFRDSGEKAIPVALIQGNIDQARKWNPAYINEQVRIYTARTRRAADQGAKLVVWPETAAPFYFSQDKNRDPVILRLAENTGADIIFGAPGYESREGGYVSFNRAWLVTPEGIAGEYDKVHLVPFGEYVPLKKFLFFVSKMVTAIGELEAGEDVNLLDLGEYRAGAQICFEIIFPQYSRLIVKKGGDVLVNITNDSWYGKTAASRQSLAMGVFRAVENRAPLLRAAQSGISAIVSPTGEIKGETGLFVEATLMGSFTPREGPLTLYTRTGDLFSWLCVGMSLWFFVFARIRLRAAGKKAG